MFGVGGRGTAEGAAGQVQARWRGAAGMQRKGGLLTAGRAREADAAKPPAFPGGDHEER